MSVQDWWQVIALLAGALGIKEVTQILVKHWTGKTSRHRAEIDRIARERDKARSERDTARDERDSEASTRRRLQESLSEHRRMMYRADCIDPQDIPEWPK